MRQDAKIASRDRTLKKRLPKEDTEILYVIKPTYEFAILDPSWIVKNSKETVATAWGNAPVYRVPANKFKNILRKDKDLNTVCNFIDKKVEIEKEKLSYLLQQVIDEEKILKIILKTLEGFFKVCFILNHIEKIPINANLWLIYLLSFLDQKLNSLELFQLIYSLDFLYPRIELEKNELNKLIEGLKQIQKQIDKFSKPDGSYQSDKTIAPLDDTRYSLFVINILEDLTQDILYYYGNNVNLVPVSRIYQNVPEIGKTFEFIYNGKLGFTLVAPSEVRDSYEIQKSYQVRNSMLRFIFMTCKISMDEPIIKAKIHLMIGLLQEMDKKFFYCLFTELMIEFMRMGTRIYVMG